MFFVSFVISPVFRGATLPASPVVDHCCCRTVRSQCRSVFPAPQVLPESLRAAADYIRSAGCCCCCRRAGQRVAMEYLRGALRRDRQRFIIKVLVSLFGGCEARRALSICLHERGEAWRGVAWRGALGCVGSIWSTPAEVDESLHYLVQIPDRGMAAPRAESRRCALQLPMLRVRPDPVRSREAETLILGQPNPTRPHPTKPQETLQFDFVTDRGCSTRPFANSEANDNAPSSLPPSPTPPPPRPPPSLTTARDAAPCIHLH